MTTLILGAVGSAVGAPLGAFGGPIGKFVGTSLGGFLDNKLFGQKRHFEGPRLEDLAVQTSTYGKMIPILYGTSRIAGNVIWSRPIREVSSTSSNGGGKGGGGRATATTTTYSYFVSLAIGLCEGPVTEVLRIWADTKQLDLSQLTLRIYTGSESQLPDAFIESFEGVGNTPAYRGLAYVVIEDFPLGDFGNRIPNFTFEVKRKLLSDDDGAGNAVENMVEAVVMIPGGGEFVLDTDIQFKIPGSQVGSSWVQQGNQERINQHNASGIANALVSLNQLEEALPNVNWISVVVGWLADSLDASAAIIKPGVEYQSGATTSPDTWAVSSFTRSTARLITQIGGGPQYGGTPDDGSLLRYLGELKDRGYNILFVPMFFMDVADKPWRGRLTGAAADVASFFTKPNGYNAFVTHYANLLVGKVDAFAIGSELVGLTKVTSTPGVYPAVSALVSLAATVKAILGSGVKVTYAADWSEYHHTDGGWYNLDPLWASAHIDVVGIDAYFPLTDAPQNGYDLQTVMDGWTSGEGYDFYYSDPARTIQAPLSAPYAWKNIAWWWGNTHTNPDSSTTAWVPASKKIWFTECGFPSVDGATNQPNVFYDPTSSESNFPYHSRGRVDFRAQRLGLTATQLQWAGSAMVERMFVWAWDARSYPFWPDLIEVWSDGAAWKTGHWLQGKLGLSNLGAIVSDICARTGLEETDFDISRLSDLVEGFVITEQQPARVCIEQLQTGYFFDAVESDHIIKFIPRGGEALLQIDSDNALPRIAEEAREVLGIAREQELELPQRVNVTYINRSANYQAGAQMSQRLVTGSRDVAHVRLPIVFPDQLAKMLADTILFNRWVARTRYTLDLPMAYAALEPADIIEVEHNGAIHTLRITSTYLGKPGRVRIEGVAEDISTYDFYTAPGSNTPVLAGSGPITATKLELLDIPAFPTDNSSAAIMRIAATGLDATWRGAVLYRSDDGLNYSSVLDITTAATMGTAITLLPAGPTAVFDETSSVTISLLGEAELSSASELSMLNGANAMLVGDEIIQFKTATLVSPSQYTLSGLLRGRLGTEYAMSTHAVGERAVLLDARLLKDAQAFSLLNLTRQYKPVTLGATLAGTTAQSFTYTGKCLKPYSPVHITGTRDGSANLTISWVRRTRANGEWRDYVDVPLNEISETYEVDIMNGANVVRTLSTSTAAASYSAAQQTTDFGAPQASVAVRVYQLSAALGPGWPGNATI